MQRLSLLISFKSDEVKLNQQKKTCLKYNSSERLNGGKLWFSHSVCEGNLYSQPAEAWASRRDHSGKLSERGAVACWGIDINSHVYENAASTSPISLCNQEPAVKRLMSCSLVPLVPTGKKRSDRGMCLRSVWGRGSKGPLKGSTDQSRHPEANNCGIKIKISLSLISSL